RAHLALPEERAMRVDDGDERGDGIGRLHSQRWNLVRAPESFEEREIVLARPGVDLLERGVPDPARREVDDAAKRLLVFGIIDELQVRERILDLFAIEELHAADDPIGD